MKSIIQPSLSYRQEGFSYGMGRMSMKREYKEYQPLTEETAVSLLQSIGLFAETDSVFCQEIGDGNLNLVFRVSHQESNHSYIIKQALPYAKVVGTSWPLTLDRARIESEALEKAYSLLPQFVPKVHYSNDEQAVTVMDDLSHLVIMRKGLIQGNHYPNVAKDIGLYLAHTLFFTSDFGMDQQEKKQLQATFANPELCKITEDLVFTDPYFDHDTNDFPESLRPFIADVIWSDRDLLKEVALLKHTFLTHSEALIHGDLHTGSIFSSTEETKVIDPEFAFVGPIGFDLGAFIANICLNYVSQIGHASHQEPLTSYRHYLLTLLEDVWGTFESEFHSLWETHGTDPLFQEKEFRQAFLAQVFADAIGFAGCKIIRRVIGLAHVEDIESIPEEQIKEQVKKQALRLGKQLILTRHEIDSMKNVIKVVKEA